MNISLVFISLQKSHLRIHQNEITQKERSSRTHHYPCYNCKENSVISSVLCCNFMSIPDPCQCCTDGDSQKAVNRAHSLGQAMGDNSVESP